jgi:hypothetical protein
VPATLPFVLVLLALGSSFCKLLDPLAGVEFEGDDEFGFAGTDGCVTFAGEAAFLPGDGVGDTGVLFAAILSEDPWICLAASSSTAAVFPFVATVFTGEADDEAVADG